MSEVSDARISTYLEPSSAPFQTFADFRSTCQSIVRCCYTADGSFRCSCKDFSSYAVCHHCTVVSHISKEIDYETPPATQRQRQGGRISKKKRTALEREKEDPPSQTERVPLHNSVNLFETTPPSPQAQSPTSSSSSSERRRGQRVRTRTRRYNLDS